MHVLTRPRGIVYGIITSTTVMSKQVTGGSAAANITKKLSADLEWTVHRFWAVIAKTTALILFGTYTLCPCHGYIINVNRLCGHGFRLQLSLVALVDLGLKTGSDGTTAPLFPKVDSSLSDQSSYFSFKTNRALIPIFIFVMFIL